MTRELNPKGIERAAKVLCEQDLANELSVAANHEAYLNYNWKSYADQATSTIAAYLDVVEGDRPSVPYDRDTLGRMVREAWTGWARSQPSPKASWLVPYDDLSEPDKEADRQIGEAIASAVALASAPPPESASGWQPIESAPKDGTYILLFPCRWTGIVAEVGRFDTDEYSKKPRPYWKRIGSRSVTDDRGTPPTHWQPLPNPPTSEQE